MIEHVLNGFHGAPADSRAFRTRVMAFFEVAVGEFTGVPQSFDSRRESVVVPVYALVKISQDKNIFEDVFVLLIGLTTFKMGFFFFEVIKNPA
jgi:hypothetical protein